MVQTRRGRRYFSNSLERPVRIVRHDMMSNHAQQTQGIPPMLFQCCASVEDGGRTLYKCYANVWCLLRDVSTYTPPPLNKVVTSKEGISAWAS